MMQHISISKPVFLLLNILAAVLFIPLFMVQQLGPLDFWWWMSFNLIILTSLAFSLDKSYRPFLTEDLGKAAGKKVLTGLASALILYGVFFAGNYLSRRMFDFAGEGIQGVYDFKGDAGSFRIVFLMAFIIGPGEELFWRGFLQRHFQEKTSKITGFIIATAIYTGIHVFTGNIMLILAALFAGLFWGWMYMKYRSMVMNIVSHTVWDVVVFIVFPFA